MKQNLKNLTEYQMAYEESIKNPEQFWANIAEDFIWHKKWTKVVSSHELTSRTKWFEGGKLNITENCIDRHLVDKAEQTAIIFEPNDPNEKPQHISYRKLAEEVNIAANMLIKMGVKKGDRVCIYLPMIPELAYALLACARIGAVHSVVFAGFSSKSLADRINDASCSLLITADGGFRGNKITPLKTIADDALKNCLSIKKVIVVNRAQLNIQMQPKRDIWWNDAIKDCSTTCTAESMDSEDMLFILYTSGSTGKPKGMVHTYGGYMVYTNYSFKNVFQYEEGDIYWCTADIGWITGHSYIIYGPLSAGATTIMFEGIPTYPQMDRFWKIVEKYKVNIFYTAPTAIRALEKCDPKLIQKCNLSSLKVLGTVGEPINKEAWQWYHETIGQKRCPIVDTWWQTETGGILISPLAGITKSIPTFATKPLPGIVPCLMDENGIEISQNKAEGHLCIKKPWPSMARTIYGNHQRFIETYFSAYEGKYFTGDAAKRDAEGNYRITGRTDDIVIVSGHNLGTAEIEDCIDEHPKVIESAVVGVPHEIKGNSIFAFVSLKDEISPSEQLKKEIIELVSHSLGPISKPENILFTPSLPKTRSGKIMRRILRKIASGEQQNLGDISTLLNPECVKELISKMTINS